ncbi:MAG: hypothetical protein ACKO0Z_11420 [Betaproteobacteria bacterium]
MKEAPVEYPGFLGIRNVAIPRKQPHGALQSAVNVDVDDEGTVVTRPGYSQAFSGTNVTAAYSMLAQDYAYIVDAGFLYRVSPSLATARLGPVATNLNEHWAEAGKFVFMSSGYIIDDTRLLEWRVLPPDDLQVDVIAGRLPAGQYQVTATQDAEDGRESVTCDVLTLSLPEGAGIRINNPSGKTIYVTEANGTVLYNAGFEVEELVDPPPYAVPLPHELLLNNPLPDQVDTVAFYDSSVYVSVFMPEHDVTNIFWSAVFRWHVFDLDRDAIQVPGEVRGMVAEAGHLFIATDRAIYKFDGGAIQPLVDYGVPRGYPFARGPSHSNYAWTNRGVVRLDTGENVTFEKVHLPPGSVCSTAIVEQHGIEKFIVLSDGDGVANNIAP